MKVSSPVGEFPFEAKRLKLENGRLILEGAMGAWPARVEVEAADLVHMARLIPWPIVALGGAALVVALGAGGRKGRRH